MARPMGEARKTPLRINSFKQSPSPECHTSTPILFGVACLHGITIHYGNSYLEPPLKKESPTAALKDERLNNRAAFSAAASPSRRRSSGLDASL